MLTPLRDILIQTARALGVERAFFLAEARAAWPDIVGGQLANVSEPGSFKNGILIVEVGHPLVAQEISLREAVILERLRQRLRDVELKGVRVAVRPRATK